MTHSTRLHIAKDLLLLLVSVGVAVFLLVSPSVEQILTVTFEREVLTSFVAGIFFTSVLTVPASIIVLGEIGSVASPWMVAAVGALGSVLGDLALFGFLKSHFNHDIEQLLKARKRWLLFSFSRFRSFTWMLPFIGGIIIASPLPDELGVALLGVTKLPTKTFIIVSYFSNFLGILLVALVGSRLSS